MKHMGSHLKSETEGTSDPTKCTLIPQKQFEKTSPEFILREKLKAAKGLFTGYIEVNEYLRKTNEMQNWYKILKYHH